jgi:hypothetical protein
MPLVGVLAVLLAVAAQASTNATWNVTFNVATAVALVNNTATGNFGPLVAGSLSAPINDDLTITSNDPAGVQLTASSAGPTVESGGVPCVPVASHTANGTSIKLTPSATTGGAGGVAGVAVAGTFLSTTATNMFSTVPTNTGTLDELVTAQIQPPTTIQPNSNGCSYSLPVNYVLIAQ